MEVWLPITGYEGLYEVSSHGRVRSLHHHPTGRLLKTPPTSRGYPKVTLHSGGSERTLSVHRLVGREFVGPCPDGMEIRHLDGNKVNNNLTNLCYGTHSANVLDSVAHGTFRQTRKTHCPAGHEYTPHNTIVRRRKRECRICNRVDPAGVPNARKTHCPSGHEYTEKNTRQDGLGRRSCRSCDREKWRAKHPGRPRRVP